MQLTNVNNVTCHVTYGAQVLCKMLEFWSSFHGGLHACHMHKMTRMKFETKVLTVNHVTIATGVGMGIVQCVHVTCEQ